MKGTKALIIIIAGILVVAGVLILIPYIYTPEGSGTYYTYNYFDFVYREGVWYTQAQVNGNVLQISLRNGPRELEDIPVEGDIAQFRDRFSSLYITFDPREENHDAYVTMSNAEISPNLVLHFGKDVLPACISEEPVCTEMDVPIVTCESTDSGVVFLNRAPGPSVRIEDNCAIITGVGEDMVRAADRFMYGLYGIMQ